MTKRTRVRFAPSPTGSIHIGNLRTALYAYLVGRQEQGDFIVRIEDTDRTRYVEGAVEKVLKTLQWAQIHSDEGVMLDDNGTVVEKGEYGPYFQSKRLSIYKEHIDQLIEQGHAYPCFCSKERLDAVRKEQQANKQSPKYDKYCLSMSKEEAKKRIEAGEGYVIRLNVPDDKIIAFTDTVYGKISVKGASVDDQVLIKSDGFPTYHFAVVVDDHLMEISHVIRGEDWLPSAPKHVLLYEYFGWEMPEFVHVPNILGENKKKLSKRQGDVSVEDFIGKGYLPEAIVNFIAYLGWHPKEDKDVMSLNEIINEFDVGRIQKGGAIFNREKLDWLNGHYINALEYDRFIEHARNFIPDTWQLNEAIIGSVQPRMKTFGELHDLVSFYFEQEAYDTETLSWKEMSLVDAKKNLSEIRDHIEKEVPENMNGRITFVEKVQASLLDYIDSRDKNRGEVLWPLRIALSGRERSPSPFEIIVGLGKEEALTRIDTAIAKISE
jgi:nondiscriminating glutamyl-tRNA synthetase